MDRLLIYEDSAGNCRIICPNEKYQQAWESEEMALCRLVNGEIPDVAEVLVCRKQHIPSDRTFREAWRKGDVACPIKIDLEHAKSIHRKLIEQAAQKKIDQLELQLTIAEENENTPEQVAIRRTKRILREIHNMDLSHCKTADDVKKSVPRELQDIFYSFSSF